jgi:hypothetical protein
VAIKQFHSTRFNVGKALFAYRAHFRADRGWLIAAKAVAGALGCDERTIRNIVADYERLSAALPTVAIEAAHSRGIDLAQRRHRQTVAAIESAIVNEGNGEFDIDEEEAERIVSNVLVMRSPNQRELVQDAPSVSLTRAERQHFAIRMKIRTALANVEPGKKLSALIAALEEEMLAVWGQKEPVTITIIPRPSAFSLDGRRRQAI